MLAVWIMSYLFCFLAGANTVALFIRYQVKRENRRMDAEIKEELDRKLDEFNNRQVVL